MYCTAFQIEIMRTAFAACVLYPHFFPLSALDALNKTVCFTHFFSLQLFFFNKTDPKNHFLPPFCFFFFRLEKDYSKICLLDREIFLPPYSAGAGNPIQFVGVKEVIHRIKRQEWFQ